MPSVLDFVSMVLMQQGGFASMARKREPADITDQWDNVVQYDEVMSTKLAVAYACGFTVAYRAARSQDGGSAVDLACGPGHFTLCLAEYLDFKQITGVDVSAPMVDVAARNAADQQMGERVRFRLGDVTELDDVGRDEFNLASFTDAAHHMPDLETVGNVLREMERITKPDGLVMIMDLVRLRTARLTERYV